jgi:hypothetical protein
VIVVIYITIFIVSLQAYELHKLTRKYVKLQIGGDYWCSDPDKNNSTLTGDNAQTTTDGIIFHNVNFLILI